MLVRDKMLVSFIVFEEGGWRERGKEGRGGRKRKTGEKGGKEREKEGGRKREFRS